MLYATRISTKISYNLSHICSIHIEKRSHMLSISTLVDRGEEIRIKRRGEKGQGARERQASSFWRPREPRDAKVWDQWSAGTMKNGSPLFPAVSIQFEPENRRLAVSRDAIYPSTRLLDTIDNLSLSFAAVSRPCLNFPMNDASSETSWSTFAPRKTAWN